MRKTAIVIVIIVAAICLCMFQFGLAGGDRVEKEGFTELLYSRVRPQARSVRLFYEDALENAIKHIDRIKYNLGKR
jgi:hypothetical protein